MALARFSSAALLLLLVAACRPTASAPDGPADTVNVFFSNYDGNFRSADRSLLSADLAADIGAAVNGERESAAAVAASEFPTDKPSILEGEIFSGLYEGFTGFSAAPARIEGDRATVPVTFTNAHYNVGWSDEVLLVDENGWKIDDVLYTGKKSGLLGLREVLGNFQEAVKAEKAALAKP
jgi:hypothetical protein